MSVILTQKDMVLAALPTGKLGSTDETKKLVVLGIRINDPDAARNDRENNKETL